MGKPETQTAEQRLVFVTGLSGSGKSAAMNAFEDMGFFCSDNVPTVLIPDFVRVLQTRRNSIPRVALVVDVRERDFFDQFIPTVERLRADGVRSEIVYLESSEESLLRRFSETKRPHPLALDSRAIDGIKKERELLKEVRNIADMIIDTTSFNVYQLRDHLRSLFRAGTQLVVTVLSFGYKFGVPLDCDLVFDVRFLKNPYYVPHLKPKTGEDAAVVEFVMEDKEAQDFVKQLVSFVKRLLPKYLREGKAYLNIGIGCTGGKHRSVVVAGKLAEALQSPKWSVNAAHRDVGKGRS